MSFENAFAIANIGASGLSAERFRMEVVANNIANAYSTRTAEGGPFRRQDVIFATVLNQKTGVGQNRPYGLNGVEVVGLADDPSAFPQVHNPGHPDADADGHVAMPNVHLPMEMVNLITASRAYEANLRVLQSFRQTSEQALTLARS